MATEHIVCFQRLQISFELLFKYSIQHRNIIKFLNLRIIHSLDVIILDQTQNIISNILDEYWKGKPTANIP